MIYCGCSCGRASTQRPTLASASSSAAFLAHRRPHACAAASWRRSRDSEPRTSDEGNWRLKLASSLAAGVLLLNAGIAGAEAQVGDVFVGTPRVVDGDTLVVGKERVRLFGLDAPESKQSCNDRQGKPYACGKTAADALRAQIGSSSVQCRVRAKDLYGRNVSSCTLPGTGDIGDWLVKNGYAVAYRQYSKAYVSDEDEAKSAHKGIWQGSFEVPADWRRENKRGGKKLEESSSGQGGALAALPKALEASTAAAQTSAGCNIKGNISAKGNRIYHVPGGRYYENVKIEPQKGEKMFCSEADAENAGFRRSKE